MPKPEIIISSDDLERLEGLLYSPAARARRDLDALRDELERAEVRAPEDMPADVIRMESRARFQDLEADRIYEFTLVYPGNAAPDTDRVSIFSPAGSALLGLSKGQIIEWPTADARTARLEVLDVVQHA
nr:nucleoside diphosphate kinase regulator [Zoogloeaceae bacterium]